MGENAYFQPSMKSEDQELKLCFVIACSYLMYCVSLTPRIECLLSTSVFFNISQPYEFQISWAGLGLALNILPPLTRLPISLISSDLTSTIKHRALSILQYTSFYLLTLQNSSNTDITLEDSSAVLPTWTLPISEPTAESFPAPPHLKPPSSQTRHADLDNQSRLFSLTLGVEPNKATLQNLASTMNSAGEMILTF